MSLEQVTSEFSILPLKIPVISPLCALVVSKVSPLHSLTDGSILQPVHLVDTQKTMSVSHVQLISLRNEEELGGGHPSIEHTQLANIATLFLLKRPLYIPYVILQVFDLVMIDKVGVDRTAKQRTGLLVDGYTVDRLPVVRFDALLVHWRVLFSVRFWVGHRNSGPLTLLRSKTMIFPISSEI